MLAIQSIFNGLCFAFGSDYWNIAFMDRGDLFGDFIKYNPAFQSDRLSIEFLKNSISDVFSLKYLCLHRLCMMQAGFSSYQQFLMKF